MTAAAAAVKYISYVLMRFKISWEMILDGQTTNSFCNKTI